jgi:hypothetical protein
MRLDELQNLKQIQKLKFSSNKGREFSFKLIQYQFKLLLLKQNGLCYQRNI